MLKALLRVRLLALGSWLTGSSRKKKAQSKLQLIGFAALMLYAMGSLGFLFWHLFDTIALPFHSFGLDWLFFAMLIIMAFGMMFVGSVFTAKAQLFEARDNDLLLSMPIKPGAILLSRMFMLAVIALVLGLLVCLPAGMAWGASVGFTGGTLLCYIVAVALTVLLSLAASALFGWLISLLTSRMQKKALVSTALSIIFLLAYMYLMFNMNNLITGLAAQPDAAAAAIGAVAPLYKFCVALAAGSLGGMAVYGLAIVAVFIGAYYLLSATFMQTSTGQHSGKKIKYVERLEKPRTPTRALFDRELSRFLSCSAYILNSGMGIIMTVIGSVLLVVKMNAVRGALSQISGAGPLLQGLGVIALCYLTSMTLISAPSVSLEGRSLWIAQSIPVSTRELLRAKLRLHNILSLPILLACAAVTAVLRPGGIMLIWTFLLPPLFSVFIGLLGLAENLRHPNLDWTNETQAVKSGVGVLFTMFISWGVLFVPVIIYLLSDADINPELLCAGLALALAAACALLWRWLMVKGTAIFEGL